MILPNRNILLKPYIFLCCLFSVWGVFGMQSFDKEEKILYKILLVGDTQVGKTSIKKRLDGENFNKNEQPTLGITFFDKEIKKKEKTIKIQIYECGGQDGNKYTVLLHRKDAHAIVFVYDITNRKSFENIKTWMDFVEQGSNNDDNIFNQKNKKKTLLYFLVGNKTDLRKKNNNTKENDNDNNNDDNEEKPVSKEEGKKFAEENNMIFLGEVSARNGNGIDDFFKEITIKCLKKIGEGTKQETYNPKNPNEKDPPWYERIYNFCCSLCKKNVKKINDAKEILQNNENSENNKIETISKNQEATSL